MLISKKELLELTGISYGQLYRWKRERLIPEEWFMKQSSFTGQETFFPREQILQRIRTIQELKDQYSLEELAKLFSPEFNGNGFTVEDFEAMYEINKECLQSFHDMMKKENYSYMELLFLVIISNLKEELNLNMDQSTGLMEGMKNHLGIMKSTDFNLIIFKKEEQFFSVIIPEQTKPHLDERLNVVKEIYMDDISNQLKVKYRSRNIDPQTEEEKAEEETSKSQSEEQNNQKKEDEDFILKINNWEVRL
jgi:hypothetical protein